MARTRSRLLGKALFFILCLCHHREGSWPILGANALAPAVERDPRYQILSHVERVKKSTVVAMRELFAILAWPWVF